MPQLSSVQQAARPSKRSHVSQPQLSGISHRLDALPAMTAVLPCRLPPAAGQPLNRLRYFLFSCSSWGWGELCHLHQSPGLPVGFLS